MNNRLYVIYDKVAEEAGPIFQAINDGIAVRQFAQTMKDVPYSIREEYVLYGIGEVDSKTLVVTGNPAYELNADRLFQKDKNMEVISNE